MSFELDTIVRQAVEHLICPTEGLLRLATDADAESLFLLINKGFYQNLCRYKRKGLEKRLEKIEEVYSLMAKGIFLLLTASDHEQATILNDECSIVACVFIHYLATDELTKQTVDAKLPVKINLLAVHPSMVKRGIARYMMEAVDAVARKFGYTDVFLPVISVNNHLVDMYTKFGFNIVETKTLANYGVDPEIFSIPCHMIIMEKALL